MTKSEARSCLLGGLLLFRRSLSLSTKPSYIKMIRRIEGNIYQVVSTTELECYVDRQTDSSQLLEWLLIDMYLRGSFCKSSRSGIHESVKNPSHLNAIIVYVSLTQLWVMLRI